MFRAIHEVKHNVKSIKNFSYPQYVKTVVISFTVRNFNVFAQCMEEPTRKKCYDFNIDLSYNFQSWQVSRFYPHFTHPNIIFAYSYIPPYTNIIN